MDNGISVSLVSLVPHHGQERDLCSAEGQLTKDFQKILNDLKNEHGFDSERTVVGEDGQTLYVTLGEVAYEVKLPYPVRSRSLGIIEMHWAGMAGFRTNSLCWSYDTDRD